MPIDPGLVLIVALAATAVSVVLFAASQRRIGAIVRRLDTLQVNVGYRCNQSCLHCHVNAGPTRTEAMTRETADQVLAYLEASGAAIDPCHRKDAGEP